MKNKKRKKRKNIERQGIYIPEAKPRDFGLVAIILFVLVILVYLIVYYNSSYWVPGRDIFEQPYIRHALAIPIIILFIYFLFSGTFIEYDPNIKKFTPHTIAMSGYIAFLLVGMVFTAIIMIPIIFAMFAVLLGFG